HRADADGANAWQLAYPLRDVENETSCIGRFFFDQGEVHFRHKIPRGHETWIEAGGFERAAEKQSGGEKQHERERDLRHDRDMAWREETAEAPDARRFADLLLEIVNEIGPGRFER